VHTYENYLRQKGEVSPASQIIDFGNIAKYDPPPEEIVKRKTETYTVNNQTDLLRLRDKHLAAHQARLALMEKRRILLEKLIAISANISAEAQVYAKVIEDERDAFLTQFNEMSTIGQEILLTHKEPDPVLKEQKYQQLRTQLNTLLGSVVEDPQSELPRLNAIFAKIEQIINAEEDQLVDGCTQPLEVCIEERQDDLENELNKLVQRIVNYPRDQQKLEQLAALIEQDVRAHLQRFEDEGDILKKSSVQIDSELKKYVEELVQITDQDLVDLFGLYENLNSEQDKFFERVEVSQKSLEQQYGILQAQMNRFMETTQEMLVADNARIAQLNNYFKMESRDILNQSKKNIRDLMAFSYSQGIEQQRLMDEFVRTQRINVKRLMESRRFQRGNYSPPIHAMEEPMETNIDPDKFLTAADFNPVEGTQSNNVHALRDLREKMKDAAP
jgi:Txe/YoeB family toxin of Txe-Axe toxin-antitoxin module